MSYCQHPHHAQPLELAHEVAPPPVVQPLAQDEHGPVPSGKPPEM